MGIRGIAGDEPHPLQCLIYGPGSKYTCRPMGRDVGEFNNISNKEALIVYGVASVIQNVTGLDPKLAK